MPVALRWLLNLAPLNPIAVRLVQGGSRRRRHLYIRSVYLGLIIAGLLYSLLIGLGSDQISFRQMATMASQAFQVAAYLQVGLICVLAPVFMAGAIAQEANPRTWDILLTTPLSPTQIVLGNLFGRLFFILALLFSSLPLFAVTQYFGGVPGRTIFASYLVAACAALLVGALAISLSVSRLVGRRAVFAFYVGVVSYLALTFAVDRLASSGGVTYMTAINPFLALMALLNPSGYPRLAPAPGQSGLGVWMLSKPVTAWCVISAGLSAGLMAASTLTVRMGGIAGLGGQSGGSGLLKTRRLKGMIGGERHRAPRTVWHNPVAWREAAARNATVGRMAARWSFIGLGGLWAVGMVLYFHGGGMSIPTFRTAVAYTATGELAIITLVALNMAATSVAREREDGTLDLLLTTPLTPSAYLRGKLRGMVAYLLPMVAVPVFTLLVSGFYTALGELGVVAPPGGTTIAYTSVTMGGGGGPVPMPAVVPEAGVWAAIVCVPFVAFCVMVGMQWSLKSKGSLSAVVATVGIVGVVAGVLGLCAFNAASDLAVLGPALGALSPATVVYAGVFPEYRMAETVGGAGGLAGARVSMLIGAAASAAIHIGVVYGLNANMVRTFDFTVRKLAGAK